MSSGRGCRGGTGRGHLRLVVPGARQRGAAGARDIRRAVAAGAASAGPAPGRGSPAPSPGPRPIAPRRRPPPPKACRGCATTCLLAEALETLGAMPEPTTIELMNVARQLMQGHVFLRVQGDARALLSEGKELPLAVVRNGDNAVPAGIQHRRGPAGERPRRRRVRRPARWDSPSAPSSATCWPGRTPGSSSTSPPRPPER